MTTGYSLYNPGGSLNFDIPLSVIQANEEDEAAEDARLKEKELQDILTNAFDDITDDEYDGSQQSPSQNSFHSESSLTNLTNQEEKRTISPPFQYNYLPKKDEILFETNGEFQQLEPETCKSETSEDHHDSGRHSNKSFRDNDWEGRYYVDRWEESTDVQSQPRLCDNDVIETRGNNLHFNDQTKSNNVQPQCFAYQPYRTESNGGNLVTYKHPDFKDKNEDFQDEFLNAGGETNEEIKFQQIQILYNARGREIQKLQQELDAIKIKASQDIESLTRSVAAQLEENREYLEKFNFCQKELESAKLIISKLEGQLRASDLQLVSLASSKNEIIQKLQAAETTIESLQTQIGELQKSENMTRIREHHAVMITSLKERFNEDTYKFKVEIDELKEALSVTKEELERQKDKLNKATTECEQVKLDKAETVNRLIKALEVSQLECQKFVNQATTLPSSLKATHDDNETNDELVKNLKDELASTKRELDLYVSAAKFGIVNDQDKAAGQSSDPFPNQFKDSLLTSLKSEVERSLTCLQNKNEQLRKLQTDWHSTCEKLKSLQQELNSSNVEKIQAQLKIQALTEELRVLKENAKELDHSEENEKLKEKIEEVSNKYNNVTQKVTRLSTLNDQYVKDIQKLKGEMSELVQKQEESNRKAIEECQETCLRLHTDASEARQMVVEKQFMEMQRTHHTQIQELVKELDTVKNMYVKVCEEKNEMENQLLEEWNKLKVEEIEDVKIKLTKKYEEELKRMKDKMDMKRSIDDHSAEQMASRIRNEMLKQLEEQLQNAKKVWEKEHEINFQEKVAAKAKELLELHLLDKGHDTSDGAIDDYLEQIQELENRVKETQELYKQNLAELEKTMMERKDKELRILRDKLMQERDVLLKEAEEQKNKELQSVIKEVELKFHKEKKKLLRELKETKASHSLNIIKAQLKNSDDGMARQQFDVILAKIEEEHQKSLKEAIAKTEEEKRRAVAEAELKSEIVLQQKMQQIIQKKEEEKVAALNQLEKKLCSELEPFLDAQKQRFLMALKQMQESHMKEKATIEQSYESKLLQLKEEYKTLVESYKEQLQGHNNWDEGNEELRVALKSLEDKYNRTEKELSEIITELKKTLLRKENKLREMETAFEQMIAKNKEDADTRIFKSEMEAVKSMKTVEEVEHYKLKYEESERNHNDLLLKYRSLKEKVKKYHKYIHNKEKEFANELMKMNDDHKVALHSISTMKEQVTDTLEKKLNDMKCSFLHVLSSLNLTEAMPTQLKPSSDQSELMKYGVSDQEQKKIVPSRNVQDMHNEFLQSVKRLQDDIKTYIDECSRSASKKIEEEMAKASWLLSEHLDSLPKDLKRLEKGSHQAPVMPQVQVPSRGSSQTVSPELTTGTSSGVGTMVGNPSSLSANADNIHNTGTQTTGLFRSEMEFLSKPLKYWSSTPFTQDHLASFNVPVLRPTPLVNKDFGIQQSELSTVAPSGLKVTYSLAPEKLKPTKEITSNPSKTFSNVTWKSVNCASSDEPVPEKLCSSTRTVTPSEEKCASATPDQNSQECQSRFLAFANSLSSMKQDFWNDIKYMKLYRPDLSKVGDAEAIPKALD